jgi:GNAT superfamily N-acetyltransferase
LATARDEGGNGDFAIRPAVPADTALILSLIRGLAEYERLLDLCVVTGEALEKWIFRAGLAEAILGEAGGVPVGFALFYPTFSTFLGKPGLYVEDLFIKPGARGKGYGRQMLRHLARLAVERGCGRLEWACLDWNRPGIAFYTSLGAEPLDAWTTYRLDGGALEGLANGAPSPAGKRPD